VGQTGNATGPHVHLEMIYEGNHVNPMRYLPAR
jgi:murein DD-endopeptidase MepM/ murein hydrolase activator NlpD